MYKQKYEYVVSHTKSRIIISLSQFGTKFRPLNLSNLQNKPLWKTHTFDKTTLGTEKFWSSEKLIVKIKEDVCPRLRKFPYQKKRCSNALARKLRVLLILFCRSMSRGFRFVCFEWWSTPESKNDSSWQIVDLMFYVWETKMFTPLTLSVQDAKMQFFPCCKLKLFMKTTLVTWNIFDWKYFCCCSTEIFLTECQLWTVTTRAIWRQESCLRWQRNLWARLL